MATGPEPETAAAIAAGPVGAAAAQARRAGPKMISREEDIPTADDVKKPIKAVLSPPVKQEREVRRYITKAGLFIKGLEGLWYLPTGETDAKGRLKRSAVDGLPRRVHRVTIEAANEFVTKVCEESGRTVSEDPITGRLKATPGWNLDIRVPGQAQSEEKAASTPTGEVRQKNTEALVSRLTEDNAAMMKTNEELQSAVKQLTERLDGGPAQVANLNKMNHEQLDAYAAVQTPPIDISGCETKAQKIGIITAYDGTQ